MDGDITKFFQQQITDQIRQQFINYLKELKANPQMNIFVTPAVQQLVSKEQKRYYQNKILHPICLNEIAKRCASGEYFFVGQFFSGLFLITQNCEYAVCYPDGRAQFREATRALDNMTIGFMNRMSASRKNIESWQLNYIRDLALKHYLDQQIPTILLKTQNDKQLRRRYEYLRGKFPITMEEFAQLEYFLKLLDPNA